MTGLSRPSLLSRTLALVPPTVLLVAQHASGAFDAYLKIGDIQGESTDAKHPGWIELDSVQWGVGRGISSAVGGNNRAASAPSISELTLTKRLDKSSPSIFLNAVGGSPTIATVTLELVHQASQVVFYRITLSNVLVSGQSQSVASGADVPMESVSLNFTKIKMEYFFQDAKGVTTAIPAVGWDLALQMKF
jgi:type VI secretion system secreted protein Hcp